jgi:hypothetical protein
MQKRSLGHAGEIVPEYPLCCAPGLRQRGSGSSFVYPAFIPQRAMRVSETCRATYQTTIGRPLKPGESILPPSTDCFQPIAHSDKFPLHLAVDSYFIRLIISCADSVIQPHRMAVDQVENMAAEPQASKACSTPAKVDIHVDWGLRFAEQDARF